MNSGRAGYKENEIIANFFAPALPPSVNKLFATNRKTGRRFKLTQAVNELDTVAAYAPAVSLRPGWYHIKFVCFIDLYYKNGGVRKWDADNRCKALVDILMKRWGLDDSYILRFSAGKAQKNTKWGEGIGVTLKYLKELQPSTQQCDKDEKRC